MYDEEESTSAVIGTAQAATEKSDDEPEYPIAVLWLPDPTSERGWCDRWVMRTKQPERRKAGFRR